MKNYNNTVYVLRNNGTQNMGIRRYSSYHTHTNRKLKSDIDFTFNLLLRSKYYSTPTLKQLDVYGKMINSKSSGISKCNKNITK